ncbi:MAG: hypothetical protein PHN84_09940 [Desulfuromonadaceae bacterium]|nr:hypothetical protein [Desulfuromonadaceae bacterium]
MKKIIVQIKALCNSIVSELFFTAHTANDTKRIQLMLKIITTITGADLPFSAVSAAFLQRPNALMLKPRLRDAAES